MSVEVYTSTVFVFHLSLYIGVVHGALYKSLFLFCLWHNTHCPWSIIQESFFVLFVTQYTLSVEHCKFPAGEWYRRLNKVNLSILYGWIMAKFSPQTDYGSGPSQSILWQTSGHIFKASYSVCCMIFQKKKKNHITWKHWSFLSHAWSPFFLLTYLYGEKWIFVRPCTLFWSISVRKNSPSFKKTLL